MTAANDDNPSPYRMTGLPSDTRSWRPFCW